MTQTLREMANGYVPDSAAVVYTSPVSGKGSRILQASATNITAATATFSLWLIPSGSSRGDDYLRVDEQSVAPGDSITIPEVVGAVMAKGTTLDWIASAASTININIGGVDVT